LPGQGDDWRISERGNQRIHLIVASDQTEWCLSDGRCGRQFNVGHEAITAAANILDRVLLFAVVADSATDFFDTRCQVRFGDETMSPDSVEEFDLRQYPVAVFQESDQQIERLWFEVHRRAGTSKLAPRHINLDLAKPDHDRILPVPIISPE
jgi:hypothetical protein